MPLHPLPAQGHLLRVPVLAPPHRPPPALPGKGGGFKEPGPCLESSSPPVLQPREGGRVTCGGRAPWAPRQGTGVLSQALRVTHCRTSDQSRPLSGPHFPHLGNTCDWTRPGCCASAGWVSSANQKVASLTPSRGEVPRGGRGSGTSKRQPMDVPLPLFFPPFPSL